MLTRKQKHILLKFFSMFSVVRGYNILVVVLAQYLAAIFIFAPNKSASKILFDVNLLMLVLASAASIAAGYIINNFYDSEKDLINRPRKSMLDKLVSQNTKLSFYFVLNFLALVFASYVSFKAVLFFSCYIFGIWWYSHKLKKLPIVGNFVSALLTVTPFFAIMVYYKNFDSVVFMHATYLFLLLSIREMVKDLENLKGDLALNYKTIPIVYGDKTAKIIITILVAITLIVSVLIINFYSTGYMQIYFWVSNLLLIIFVNILWNSTNKKQYLILHNILKLIIVTGVFSIVLIDVNVVLNQI